MKNDIHNPKSLLNIVSNIIFDNVISGTTSLKEISNILDSTTYKMITNKLEKYDFHKWKYNIYDSLVEIESNSWINVNIQFNKYYDEDKYRDWYEDIEIWLSDETCIIIEQHNHQYWNSYIKKVRELLVEDIDYLSEE